MAKNIIIFGGSGFIGSALSKALLKEKYQLRVICTNKQKAIQAIGANSNLTIKNFDIFNETVLKEELRHHDIVINLIGKLFEGQKGDFDKFHHHFPKILSKNITSKQKLIHISALGIDKSSKSSLYAKSKLEGEKAILKNAKNYNIIRPSIVFGQNDNFFNLFARMAKISPLLPLIGGGKSLFTPIYVQDLVKAITSLIKEDKKYKNQLFQAYGPKESSFKELMSFILKTINKRRLLLPIPYKIAKIQANFINLLKIYLLTADQVELLKYDNIGNSDLPNIDKLVGKLENYENVVPKYLTKN